MADINDLIDQQAQAAASEEGDDKKAPESIKINLGEQTVEISDPEQARIVKSAFDRLHGQYGSQLENLRREALASIGTQRLVPQEPAPPAGQPAAVEVPDPDLLFSNKRAWEDGFQRSLETRLEALERRNEALVRATVDTFQDELVRREQAAEARRLQDRLVAETFEKHPALKKKPALLWATMDEEWETLRHLPVNVAFDRAAELAVAQVAPEPQQARAGGRAPAAPNLLSSARRGAGNSGGEGAGEKRMSISDRIWERRERFLRGAK